MSKYFKVSFIISLYNFLKFLVVFTICFLNLSLIKAQIGNDGSGAKSGAMGGYNVTISDVWSINNNQTGLGFVKNFSAGVYYKNRFLLKETGHKSVAFVMPLKFGVIGIGATSFGFDLYNETKVGLSYGKRFGDKFSMGIQINYLNTQVTQQYGTNISFTSAFGLIAKLTKGLSFGAHVYNPTRSNLKEHGSEGVLTIMKLGIDYQFSKKIMFAISTLKSMRFDAKVNVGIEYNVSKTFFLRGGISTNPSEYAFGLGMKFNYFKVDLSSSIHHTLGITPGISIIYIKNEKSKKEVIRDF